MSDDSWTTLEHKTPESKKSAIKFLIVTCHVGLLSWCGKADGVSVHQPQSHASGTQHEPERKWLQISWHP